MDDDLEVMPPTAIDTPPPTPGVPLPPPEGSPSPRGLQEFSPRPVSPPDSAVPASPSSSQSPPDLGNEMESRVKKAQEDDDANWLIQQTGGERKPDQGVALGAVAGPALNPNNPLDARPIEGTEKDGVKVLGGVIGDLVQGGAETPRAVVTGTTAALQNTANLIGNIGQELRKYLPKSISGGIDIEGRTAAIAAMGPGGLAAIASDLIAGTNVTGVNHAKYLDADEWAAMKAKNGPGIFEVPGSGIASPVSNTGKMIKSMVQFAVGFAEMGALSGTTSTALQMFGGSFLAFEKQSKNLADVIQEHPQLNQPVFDYFAANPADGEFKGRFKQSVMDMGVGLAVGKVLDLFAMGMDAVKSYHTLDGLARRFGTDYAPEGGIPPREVQPYETAVFGPQSADKHWSNYFTVDGAKELLDQMQIRGRELHLNAMGGKLPEPSEDAVKPWAESWEESKTTSAGDLIMNWKPGQAFNSSQNLAIEHAYRGSAEAVAEAAPRAGSIPSDANLAAVTQRGALHAQILAAKEGATEEAGRALNIFNTGMAEGKTADQIAGILKNSGGAQNAWEMANSIVKLSKTSSQQAVDSLVRTGVKFGDAISNTIVQGLLGPTTIGVKFSSDFANALTQLNNRAVAARISAQLGTEDGVALGEALAGAHTTVTTTMQSLHALGKNLLKARSISDILAAPDSTLAELRTRYGIPFSAMEQPKGQEGANIWSASLWGRNTGEDAPSFGRVLDFFDQATRAPGRVVQDIHNFSWMMNYRSEITMQSVRQAMKEVTEGAIEPGNFQKRAAQLADDIPDNFHQAAKEYANYNTFTQDPAPALAKIGSALQQFPFVGRVLLPFKNIPANILTESFEGTPMAPFIGSWRADIAAGGAKADIAMARMATGTALLQMATDMAFRGQITGKAPTDHLGRYQFDSLKKQEYSFKVPGTENTYISYERLGPIGALLGYGADFAQACTNVGDNVDTKGLEKALAAGVFSIGGNVLHKTYMMSLSQLVTALNEPDQKAEKFMQHIATMAIPSAVGTATRLIDPTARAADTILQAELNKLPYFSKGQAPYRNQWGDVRSYESPAGAMYQAFSPYWLKSESPEPIDKELQRLNWAPSDVRSPITVGQIGNPAQRVQIDAKQLSRYKELAGNEYKDPINDGMGAKDFLNSVVTGQNAKWSPMYNALGEMDKAMGTTAQKDFIENQIKRYREGAAQQLISEDGKLQTDYKARLDKKISPVMRSMGAGHVQLQQR